MISDMRPPTDVLIVDDDALVRHSLVQILRLDNEITVIGEASSGNDALAQLLEITPHVVLLDIRMPDGDGLSTLREIRQKYPKIRCIIVTTFGDDAHIAKAVELGADGFVLKSGDPREISFAVKAAADGGAYFSPAISRKLLSTKSAQQLSRQQHAQDQLRLLTSRERDVLQLLSEGRTNAEIAQGLFISEGTVKTHVTSLLRTLGVTNRVAAAIVAIEARGLR